MSKEKTLLMFKSRLNLNCLHADLSDAILHRTPLQSLPDLLAFLSIVILILSVAGNKILKQLITFSRDHRFESTNGASSVLVSGN
jgi:hypothetical protein